MAEFKSDIMYQILENKETKKLLNVSGSSHGI